jgi:hypothetical protein
LAWQDGGARRAGAQPAPPQSGASSRSPAGLGLSRADWEETRVRGRRKKRRRKGTKVANSDILERKKNGFKKFQNVITFVSVIH